MNMKVDKNELAKDISAFASLLVKLGFDNCVENQKIFVEMCNESGFRTTSGKEFTQMSFRNLFSRLSNRVKFEIRDQFAWGENHTQGISPLASIYNV